VKIILELLFKIILEFFTEIDLPVEEENLQGTWVVPSVKGPTLGFCSGHDLMVVGLSPCPALLSV